MQGSIGELPIAETFVSIQGEGMYAGTRMFFIRLAGCNVGEYKYDEIHQRGAKMENVVQGLNVFDEHLVLEKKHSICTSATGQRFLCDTDYHKTRTASYEELYKEMFDSKCHHFLFTGGEPLLHDLSDFADHFPGTYHDPQVWHVETSGTKPVGEIEDWCTCITCSPKKDFLLENLCHIHQLKFVVGNEEELLDVRNLLTEWRQQIDLHLRELPVYISPVAPVKLEGLSDMQVYFGLAKKLYNSPNWHPAWRLNLQQHKILGVR